MAAAGSSDGSGNWGQGSGSWNRGGWNDDNASWRAQENKRKKSTPANAAKEDRTQKLVAEIKKEKEKGFQFEAGKRSAVRETETERDSERRQGEAKALQRSLDECSEKLKASEARHNSLHAQAYYSP